MASDTREAEDAVDERPPSLSVVRPATDHWGNHRGDQGKAVGAKTTGEGRGTGAGEGQGETCGVDEAEDDAELSHGEAEGKGGLRGRGATIAGQHSGAAPLPTLHCIPATLSAARSVKGEDRNEEGRRTGATQGGGEGGR